jgi:hypothetical protein
MGAAFGLFAIFSMLRYRTEGITTKDMTFLFISISMGLFCAIGNIAVEELILINSIVVLFIMVFERNWFVRNEIYKPITYENLDIVKLGDEKLLNDLKLRTGINIHKVTVEQINFERGSADVIIYYYDKNDVPIFLR